MLMMRVLSGRPGPLLLAVLLAALASLPQILPIHEIVDHQDPLFSIWRLNWIGHALFDSAARLFHGNIFYPHEYTLTYSDAVLFQGMFGTALRLAGLSPPVAYNLLLWISFPIAGLSMFLLARHVSGSAWAAVPAALAYALSAYRFDHIMHLEQVWTQWLPLNVFLALRACERRTWRSALALAAGLLVQLTSGLYLFLYTVTALPVFILAEFAATRSIPWRSVLRIAAVGLLVVVPVVAAYAHLYTLGLGNVAPRSLEDARAYSASLGSFFASPERNVVFGWTERLWGNGMNEQQIFPGLAAMALAVMALFRPHRPYRLALATLAGFSTLMALGLNGPLYALFYTFVPGYANLRVPTRYGAFLSLAVAALAACALADLVRRLASDRARLGLTASLVVLVLAETATGRPYIRAVPETPTALDTYLGGQPDTVVMEFPFAQPGWLPGNDPLYQMRSIHHWRPLVNGYSGNYPPDYLLLLERLMRVPPGSTPWIDLIRNAGATHLVVHKGLEKPDITGRLLFELERRTDLESIGEMACWPDSCGVYRLLNPKP